MKSKLLLISLVSIVLTGCFNKGPSEKELILIKENQELKEQLELERSEVPDIIENPSLSELSAAEIAERNAIHNEIQGVNNQVKQIKLNKIKEAEAKKAKLEAEKKKAEAARQKEVDDLLKVRPVQPPVQVYTPPVQESGTVKVNTKSSDLILRSGSTTNSTPLDSLPKGTKVEYGQTKQVGNHTWYQVNYNGKTGWLRGDYLKED